MEIKLYPPYEIKNTNDTTEITGYRMEKPVRAERGTAALRYDEFFSNWLTTRMTIELKAINLITRNDGR